MPKTKKSNTTDDNPQPKKERPAVPARNVQKRQKEHSEKLQEYIDGAVKIFEACLEEPRVWQSPQMQEIRQLTAKINSDSQRFPPAIPGLDSNKEGQTHDLVALTSGFAASLASREHTCSDSIKPILLVRTHATSDNKHFTPHDSHMSLIPDYVF